MKLYEIFPWFSTLFLGLALAMIVCLFLSSQGCVGVLTEASRAEVRQIIVATSPDATYARALRAAQAMNSTIVAQDPVAHVFTTKVNAAVGLHVDVRMVETGTQMTVTGSILPQQVAVGPFSAPDDFLRAYWRERG